MILPEQLPAGARIWIFQSDRELPASTISALLERSTAFIASWAAHKKLLNASVAVRYNRFLLFGVDEGIVKASGCSMDDLFYFIGETEKVLGLSLLNRLLISYKNEEGEVKTVSSDRFGQLLKEGAIHDHTIVFDNSISSAEALREHWEVPFVKSWLYRLYVAAR